MSYKQRGLLAVAILVAAAMIVSGCTQSLSQPSAATPTLIPTGLFVSPFPSVANPMDMIEEFAKQTAAAQTVIASGGTPGAPAPLVTGTVLTPQTGGTPTPTPTGTQSTPTNVVVQCTPPPACPAGQTFTCPAGAICQGGCGVVCAPITPTYTPVTPGVRPSTYTLQKDEFPYCIARRYNLNPAELLTDNELTSGDIFLPGYVLNLQQVSSPFPGDRALRKHPDTYTVIGNSDTTVYGVACKFGDVEPALIVAQNPGISVSSTLTIGQPLKIP